MAALKGRRNKKSHLPPLIIFLQAAWHVYLSFFNAFVHYLVTLFVRSLVNDVVHSCRFTLRLVLHVSFMSLVKYLDGPLG